MKKSQLLQLSHIQKRHFYVGVDVLVSAKITIITISVLAIVDHTYAEHSILPTLKRFTNTSIQKYKCHSL